MAAESNTLIQLLMFLNTSEREQNKILSAYNKITTQQQQYINTKAGELFNIDQELDNPLFNDIRESLYKMQLNTIYIYMLHVMPKCEEVIKQIFTTFTKKINKTNEILEAAINLPSGVDGSVLGSSSPSGGGAPVLGSVPHLLIGGNAIKKNNDKIKYILMHLVEAFQFYNTDTMVKILTLLTEKDKIKNLLSSLNNVSEENKSITKFYELFFIKLNKFPKLIELLKDIDKNVEYMINYDTKNYIKLNNIPSQPICEIKHLSLLYNNIIIHKNNDLHNLSKIYKCKKILPHQNGDVKYILTYSFIYLLHQQSINNLLLFLNNELISSELLVLVNQLIYNILLLKKVYYTNFDLDKLNTLYNEYINSKTNETYNY
jgi:hypothetical protein